MASTAGGDPVRAEVERRLHAIVDVAVGVPFALVAGAGICVLRRIGAVGERVTRPVRVVRSFLDVATRPSGRDSSPPAPASPAPSASVGADVAPVPADPPATSASRTEDPQPTAMSSAADLPIDEYESLAASQVVARLSSLTPSELGVVRRFEADHRGRRTVLGKIDQLLAAT